MVQKIVMYDKEKEIERLKAQLAEQDEICTKLKGDLRVAERETSNLEYINNNLKKSEVLNKIGVINHVLYENKEGNVCFIINQLEVTI